MQTLDVIFRKDKARLRRSGETGDVIAVFPSEPGTGPHDFTAYTRQEGHVTASAEWVRRSTTPASPTEYAPLLAELRSIYERPDDQERATLRPMRPMLRMQRHHYYQRKETCQ